MWRIRDALITLGCSLLSAAFRPFRGAPLLPPDPAILIVKPCCLGDLLLATPALAALRARYPAAQIVLATTSWSQPAVNHNPHITEIVTLPEAFGSRSPTALLKGALRLRGRRFDAAVVLDRSPAMTLLPSLLGIPFRAGIDSGGRGFALTHPVPALPQRHEAGLYLDVVKELGCTAERPRLEFFPSEEERGWARSRLPNGTLWAALHPGGGANPGSTLAGKRWPVERFAELGGRMLAAGYGLVVVGSPGDRALASEVLALLGGSVGADLIIDLAGETSFGQLGATLERCVLFVGNDTGPMHLAVAVGTAVVAIFGPSQPRAYGPYNGPSALVYHGDECNSCEFQGGLAVRCRREFACTRAASVDEVWEAALGLLEAQRTSAMATEPGTPSV